tara:strand:- start:3352 stop:4104 length:753 start_codon:yes stop_codon:yes gene_type:complete
MSLGGDKTGTQTVTNNPPAYAAPYLAYGANEAQRLYDTGGGFNYYPEHMVAGFSPEQEMAMTMQTNRALSGSPLNRSSQNLALDTLQGNFLNANNPYLQQAVINPITERVQGTFSQAGRLGSAYNQNALTNALSDVYYRNYENERARQNAMIGAAPELARADLQDYADLARVGAMRQQQAQKDILANADRFNFLQSAPAQNLNQFIGQVGNTAGGYGQQTSPYQYNPFNQALGTISNIVGIGTGIKGLFS